MSHLPLGVRPITPKTFNVQMKRSKYRIISEDTVGSVTERFNMCQEIRMHRFDHRYRRPYCFSQ